MIEQLLNRIKFIEENAYKTINATNTREELESIRVKFTGKNGELTEILSHLKDLSIEDKKVIGEKSNLLKNKILELVKNKNNEITQKDIIKSVSNKGGFDTTLPGKINDFGSLHPITIVQREIEKIFIGMGFTIADGPEVEDDYFNFEALNIPPNHPARDMQDTYWMKNGQLLRTHTSPCQVRAMKKYGAPLKVIAPGRCFRNESIDASHENTFFQLEGMMIDKNVSIANLIYVMKLLLSQVFNREVNVRLRPGFFPFVEPGFELDLNCMICGGKGCPTCGHTGWIELVPCGMIHPNVLRHGGIDPNEYTGFAFGLGLSRLAMMKYGIHDVRVFNSGDLRALKQFSTR